MQTQTLDLIKDIVFLVFFFLGALWMWNIVRLPYNTQQKLERIFNRSRYRFKWLFLIGFLALAGLFIWQEILRN